MFDLLHDLPGVIYEFVLHKEGSNTFSYVSDNCIDILGISAEALQKDSSLFKKIIFHDDVSEFEHSKRISHESGIAWNWEGRIWHSNSVRWIETRSNPIRSGNENLRKGIIIDITERKQRELEKELRFQSLVESLPVGVGIHVNGELVVANAHAHKLMGANPDELIGKNILEFIHEESKDLVLHRTQQVLSGESVPPIEARYVRLDGEVIEVETSALPFIYKGNPAVQFIVRDITESNRARDEMRKNESFFSQLFNNIPIAVVRLNETGKVELVNQGFTEMFGYSLSELKGKNLNDFIVPAEFQNEGIDINNLITSNKVIRLEVVRKCKNGKYVNIILYGMPVRLEEQIIGIYGVYVDITERKKMEEELKIRNAELDNFVYKVSHDLRAPLSSIIGLVNLAAFQGNPDNPYDYLKLIGEKANGLDHFINDVLSHSKNLKLEVNKERINLKEILTQTISDLNYLQGIDQVDFEIQANGIEFNSDPWRISEIFRNIMSNSIKYRNLNGPKPFVRVDITIDENMARISFNDNGIGIKKESLDKIFDMFYRATEQSDGSGIGLYIVKNAVEKLSGKIRVDSIVGKGTLIELEIPNQKA